MQSDNAVDHLNLSHLFTANYLCAQGSATSTRSTKFQTKHYQPPYEFLALLSAAICEVSTFFCSTSFIITAAGFVTTTDGRATQFSLREHNVFVYILLRHEFICYKTVPPVAFQKVLFMSSRLTFLVHMVLLPLESKFEFIVS